MAKGKNNLSFEEALEKLEQAADDLALPRITLAEAMKQYELGIRYHQQCEAILSEAKQKIEVYCSTD